MKQYLCFEQLGAAEKYQKETGGELTPFGEDRDLELFYSNVLGIDTVKYRYVVERII